MQRHGELRMALEKPNESLSDFRAATSRRLIADNERPANRARVFRAVSRPLMERGADQRTSFRDFHDSSRPRR